MGIPALAIGGMQVSDELLNEAASHRRVFVALDNTPDALEKNHEIARKLGSIAFIPRLPDAVKDANDWLTQGGTVEAMQAMLNKAKTWLQTEIERAAFLVGLERKDAIRELFQHAVDLDELELSDFRAALAKLGMKGRVFNDLLKARERRPNRKQEADDMPQI